MKILSAIILASSVAAAASAQVAPGQAGHYSGTYNVKTETTDGSINDHSKLRVNCEIKEDGSTLITSEDGLEVGGTLLSGERLGFFSYGDNEFTTGTGIWKFNRRGKIKATLQLVVNPGGTAFVSSAKLKLKKDQELAEIE